MLGADFELWIDAERGVVLRLVERFRGRNYSVTELRRVQFDQPLAGDVFHPQPPSGQVFEAPRDIAPKTLPMEGAIERCAFRVFIPDYLPANIGTWDGSVMVDQAGRWISLSCLDQERQPQTRLTLSEGLTEAVDEGRVEDLTTYETVDWSGRRMFVRHEESPYGEWHAIRFARDGTDIRLFAMLDREEILRVADSLYPH